MPYIGNKNITVPQLLIKVPHIIEGIKQSAISNRKHSATAKNSLSATFYKRKKAECYVIKTYSATAKNSVSATYYKRKKVECH